MKGYEHWKTVFMEEEFIKMRKEAGVKILAKGFDTQNERVYVVQEMVSMEVIQNAMAKNQEKIKEAGVDMSTMQMIPLQDWFKRLITSVGSKIFIKCYIKKIYEYM